MSAAIVNKVMRMMGIGEEDDTEYDDEVDYYDEEEQEEVEKESPKARRSFRDIESSNPYSRSYNIICILF